MMLRTKPLSTLSQCARNFYLSGSRCGGADGAACTCSDDDSSVKGRRSLRTNSLLKQHKLNAVPGTAAKAGSPSLKDAFASVSHLSPQSHVDAVSAPCVASPSSTSISVSIKINSNSADVQARQSGLMSSSTMTAQNFVKAGIATVGMLSELVNYRIPATDGHNHLTTPNCVVGTTFTNSNTRSANGNSRNQAKYSKVEASSSISTEERSNSNPTSRNNPGAKACYNTDASSERNTSNVRVTASATEHVRSSSKFQSVNQSVNSVCAVELYHRTLQQLKWGPKAEETLNDLQCKLDAYQANQVLKQLRDYSVALGLFKWLKLQAGFKHDDHTYTTMIGIVGHWHHKTSVR